MRRLTKTDRIPLEDYNEAVDTVNRVNGPDAPLPRSSARGEVKIVNRSGDTLPPFSVVTLQYWNQFLQTDETQLLNDGVLLRAVTPSLPDVDDSGIAVTTTSAAPDEVITARMSGVVPVRVRELDLENEHATKHHYARPVAGETYMETTRESKFKIIHRYSNPDADGMVWALIRLPETESLHIFTHYGTKSVVLDPESNIFEQKFKSEYHHFYNPDVWNPLGVNDDAPFVVARIAGIGLVRLPDHRVWAEVSMTREWLAGHVLNVHGALLVIQWPTPIETSDGYGIVPCLPLACCAMGVQARAQRESNPGDWVDDVIPSQNIHYSYHNDSHCMRPDPVGAWAYREMSGWRYAPIFIRQATITSESSAHLRIDGMATDLTYDRPAGAPWYTRTDAHVCPDIQDGDRVTVLVEVGYYGAPRVTPIHFPQKIYLETLENRIESAQNEIDNFYPSISQLSGAISTIQNRLTAGGL